MQTPWPARPHPRSRGTRPFWRPGLRGLVGLLALLLLAWLPPALQAADPAWEPQPLDAYPRPADDNGRGIHWAPVLVAQPREMVDRYLEEVAAMEMRWLAVMQPDQPALEHAYLLRQAVGRGMEPVLRVYRPFNDAYRHLEALVTAGRSVGVRYYELYSNPNVAGVVGGWRPGQAVDPEGLARLWADAARTVRAAGGFPGLPSLSPTGTVDDRVFLRRFLQALRAQGNLDALDGAWLPVQAYMGNRPLDDPEGFQRFRIYHRILQEEVGHSLPLIATEGGALLGDRSRPDRPPVTPQAMAQQTVAAFRFMQDQAPDYFFAFMPWVLAVQAAGGYGPAWERQAWFPAKGAPLPVVEAVKALAREEGAGPTGPSPGEGPRRSPTPALQYAGQPPERSSFQSAEEDSRRLLPEEAPAPSRTQDSSGSSADPGGAAAPEVQVIAQPERILSTGPVTVTEGTVVLPTYDFQPALVATRPDDPIYPAPRLDHGRVGPPEPRTYRAIFLENDFVRLTLLPELGGRIYRWQDKQTGRDILYANPVVKPTRWGIRGWWLAVGGMEWVFPLPDRGLVEYRPWTAEVVAEPRSAGVTLRYRGPQDVEVAVQVGLSADQRFFAVTTELRNRGVEPARIHYWTNAMLAPGNTVDPESRLLWPADAIRVHDVADGEGLAPGQVLAWPRGAGRDLSVLAQWPGQMSGFAPDGARQGAMGLADPTDELAIVRVFPREQVPGVKVFYGPGLDPSLWTDGPGGRYLELWGGPGLDFASPLVLEPGQSIRWSEQWYTVPGLGPFVAANAQAALALHPRGARTELRLAPVGQAATGDQRLRIQVDGQTVYDGPVTLALHQVTRLEVGAPLSAGRWIVQLMDPWGRVLLAYDSRPPTAGEPEDLPVDWDARLDDLGIQIVRAQVRKGQTYWRVVRAEFQDPQEGGGRHHIFIEVLDEDGQRIVGQEVQVFWPDGSATVVTEDKPPPEYAANFPMYGDLGGYSVRLPGLSDMVTGMGLPGGRMHVVYRLVFQRTVK